MKIILNTQLYYQWYIKLVFWTVLSKSSPFTNFSDWNVLTFRIFYWGWNFHSKITKLKFNRSEKLTSENFVTYVTLYGDRKLIVSSSFQIEPENDFPLTRHQFFQLFLRGTQKVRARSPSKVHKAISWKRKITTQNVFKFFCDAKLQKLVSRKKN